MSDANLFGAEHVRRYVETDGEVGYIWREGAPILILTVKGRKSGKEYSTPLIFGEDGGNYVIVGSQGGAPQHPAAEATRPSAPDYAAQTPRCSGWTPSRQLSQSLFLKRQ